jgi:hypothetical protein
LITRTIAKVFAIGVLVLAILTGTVSSAPKTTLTTTVHTNIIPLQVYDLVITTPTRGFAWNFTVDLTGKDPGSDRFNLVVDASGSTAQQVPLVVLFSDANLTQWLSEPLTTHNTQELAYSAYVPTSYNSFITGNQVIAGAETMTFFPPASGLYHVITLNPNAFENLTPGVQATIHMEIHGQETWTTTTIS